jgi:branched-chain amino acid transport system permease protein
MRPGARPKVRRDLIALGIFAVVYLIICALVRNSYYQLMLTLVPIWAVMGLSWNVLSGYSGLISFGHASFFGLGAYTVTLALVYWNLTPWLGIPLGMVVGAVAGLLIGLPTFRLRGHYFALAMLAYPLAILYVLQYLGFQEVSLPMKREHPAAFLQFSDPRIYTVIAVGLLLLAMGVSIAVENTRFGLSLMAIRQNELAAEAAGINARLWKLRAVVVSGAMGAAAGGLYACVLLVVTPDAVFGVLVSAQALVVTLFGGVATVWGPLIGSVILIPLAETLNAELGNIIPGIQGVVYGLAIIVIMLLAPEGLFWTVRDRFRKPASATPAPLPVEPIAVTAPVATTDRTPLLEVSGLSRAFGGLRAVDDVSFTVPRGTIFGIIGPNGAGKTTLFNVLNGVLAADEGTATLDGQAMVGRKLHQIARMGVGRTFQVVRSFPRLPLLDNVVVGAYGAGLSDTDAVRAAAEALNRVGLSHLTDVPAGQLTNKGLRLMELARALAGRPRLLLLDETLAGLGREECDDVLAVLQRLRAEGMTIAIIEHTMHAMLRIADSFLVIDHGRVLASGAPREVVENPEVIEAYLGKKWLNRCST